MFSPNLFGLSSRAVAISQHRYTIMSISSNNFLFLLTLMRASDYQMINKWTQLLNLDLFYTTDLHFCLSYECLENRCNKNKSQLFLYIFCIIFSRLDKVYITDIKIDFQTKNNNRTFT